MPIALMHKTDDPTCEEKCTPRCCVLLCICAFLVGCETNPTSDATGADSESSSTETATTVAVSRNPEQVKTGAASYFQEVTAAAGLSEEEAPWPDGLYMTPEITPGGVALLDFDQDGRLDIYQICHCPPTPMPNSFRVPAPNKLFRQTEQGTFEEVESAAGLDDSGYGHGAALGDIDNDGDVDVYVTNYGPDSFFLNQGNGAFTKRTKQAGFTADLWSSAAAFVDYDRDGDLDLFVVHFATFDAARQCAGADGSDVDYCGPHLFDGMQDKLFRNDGKGKFTDVSADAGITVPARGWGIIAMDLTGDDWPDFYVCNDEEPNQLWVNQGDGTFVDEAVFRGVAFNGMGRPEASMGVTVGDVNGDQALDLFMTHVTSETNTMYVQESADLFTDTSAKSGTAAVDLPYTGWGCGFLDMDHDGDLDLAVANGRVAVGSVDPTSNHGTFWNRYAEQNLLFSNDGTGVFTDVSAEAGTFAQRPEVTRGLALGDLDNDGDVDLVSNDLANRLRIFHNCQEQRPTNQNHWLQILAMDGKRVGIGAVISLQVGDREIVRPVLRSYSYLASNDPRVHFGLGAADKVEQVSVRWSDGSVDSFRVDQVDCDVVLEKGQGSN